MKVILIHQLDQETVSTFFHSISVIVVCARCYACLLEISPGECIALSYCLFTINRCFLNNPTKTCWMALSVLSGDIPRVLSTDHITYGPLARYVKLRVAHAPGMPGTFSLPPWVSDPDMHHGTCVTHVLWCMPGSLYSGFLWSQWREKRSRRMRNPQFYVSGKRPM